MTHLSDDDLVLHYYADPECPPGAAAHLAQCEGCRRRYSDLSATLALLPADEIPSRGDEYGLEVWERVRPAIGAGDRSGAGWRALAMAASLLLVAGAVFVANRWTSPPPAIELADADRTPERADEESRRVLRMAVADHLERSDRVLTEVMNAGSDEFLETQKGWAEDLVWAGRLYRQSALESNERSVAAVLDDVERTLLDIAHSPAQPGDAELEDVRRRVESAALLFKVRVLRDELQQPRAARGESSITLSEAS